MGCILILARGSVYQSFFLYCIGNSELIKAPAFVICVFMTKYQMRMLKAYFMFHTLHLHTVIFQFYMIVRVFYDTVVQ